jgi:hypothetical protein
MFVEPNLAGTPLQGTITFTPNPAVITFPTQNVIVAGTESVDLDVNGEFTLSLVSTDQAGENPTGWLYTVSEKLIGQKPRTYNIALPYNGGLTIELADVTPTDALPNYIPVVGPQGAPGIVTTVNGHSAAVITLTSADVGAIPTTAINAANGVVGISAAGRVGVGITGGALWAKFMVQSAADEILAAFVQTNAAATNPGFLVQGAAATWTAFGASVAGDAQNRFNFTAGGNLTWGPGTGNTDVGMYRSSAGNLNTTGQMSSDQAAPTLPSHFTRKDYVDLLDSTQNTNINTKDAQNVKITGTQSIAGAKNFTTSTQTAQFGVGVAPGTQRAHIVSVVDEVGLQVEQVTATGTNAAMLVNVFDNTMTALAVRVSGDTSSRLVIKSSGQIEWGPGGSTARDVNLYRSNVGTVNVSGQLWIDTTAPTAAGHVTRKDYVDNNFDSLTGNQTISGVKTFTSAPILQAGAAATIVGNARVTGDTVSRLTVGADGKLSWGAGGSTATDVTLSRISAGLLNVGGGLQTQNATGTAATATSFASNITGDTFDRLRIYGDGKHEWGTGAATRDTNLYRSGVGILKTDTALVVAGQLTVGSSGIYVISDWATLASLGTFQNGATVGTKVPKARKIMFLGIEVWELSGEVNMGSWTGTTFFSFTNGASSGWAPVRERDYSLQGGSGSAAGVGTLRAYWNNAGNMGVSPTPGTLPTYINLETMRAVDPNV